MKDYRAELDGLQNHRDVCPMHSGTADFNSICAAEKSVFRALDVVRRHALLPGPEDNDLCSLTAQDKSYLELLMEYESYEEGLASDVLYDESMHDRMLVVKRVLIDGAEFTKYGLDCLCQVTSDNELFIFYLNLDFHVVYKKDGELYLLATEEEMLSEYPDLMWIGLDEKFNHKNPAQTKRKFTSSFSPVNENWFSNLNQFLEELEAEPERKIETIGPQKVEPAICLPTKEGKEVQGSCGDTKGTQKKESEIGGSESSVQESCESAEGKASEVQQGADVKLIEITVPGRFLRFMNRGLDGQDVQVLDWELTTWSNSKMSVSQVDWHEEHTVKASNITIDDPAVVSRMLEDFRSLPPPREHSDDEAVATAAAAAAPQAQKQLEFHNLSMCQPHLGPNGDDLVYLVAREKYLDHKAWLVAVDMKKGTLKRVSDIGNQGHPFCHRIHCLTRISKYTNPRKRLIKSSATDPVSVDEEESNYQAGAVE